MMGCCGCVLKHKQRRSTCMVLPATTLFPFPNFSKRKWWWFFSLSHIQTSDAQTGPDGSFPMSAISQAFKFHLQFLCHNILLTLLGPVTFQHYITSQRANSIRKRHKEPRIISLCSYKISLWQSKREEERAHSFPGRPQQALADKLVHKGREPEIAHVHPNLTACKSWIETYSELLTKTQKRIRLLGPCKQAEEGGVTNKGTMGETSLVYHFS